MRPTSAWRRAAAALLAAAGAIGIAGCSALPTRPALEAQASLPPAPGGALATRFEPLVRAHPKLSGFVPLEDGRDAFAARLWMVDRAERSLDVQCYIWRADRSGRWLLAKLVEAADRGVRVRLLLDDNNASGELDALLAAVDAHERIEVRMFNPYASRGLGRPFELAADFKRLNRRMHNKTFSADGQVTLLGGRNAGDEYFGVDDAMQFADLDVLAVGPVVADVATAFDRYWNSPSAWPHALLAGPAAAKADARRVAESERYARELLDRPRQQRWRNDGPRDADFAWGRATLLVDPPDKVEDEAAPHELMQPKLQRALGRAERSIELVSPYFVPSAEEIADFAALKRDGVRLRVLTNSLAATDVPAVHAGYADRRRALLDAGVELYELKPTGDGTRTRGRLLRFGSSREASLHAKTFAVDGTRVFVGSFNFDPRSARLNTEIGVLLEHPGLAQRIGAAFDQDVPRQTWSVGRHGDGLRWTEATDTGPRTHDDEPGTSWSLRWMTRFLSLLPIDDLL